MECFSMIPNEGAWVELVDTNVGPFTRHFVSHIFSFGWAVLFFLAISSFISWSTHMIMLTITAGTKGVVRQFAFFFLCLHLQMTFFAIVLFAFPGIQVLVSWDHGLT